MFSRFAFCLLLTLSATWVKGQSEVKGPSPRDSYLKAAEHSYRLKGLRQSPYARFSQYYQFGGADGDLGAESKVDPLSAATGVVRGLSWISKGIVAIIVLPILLPIIIGPIILIALLIYFIPVLRVELQSSDVGRKWGSVSDGARTLYDISVKEECFERLACQAARAVPSGSLSASVKNWVQAKLEGFENGVLKRLGRSLRIAGSDCQKYRCSAGRRLGAYLKSLGGKKS